MLRFSLYDADLQTRTIAAVNQFDNQTHMIAFQQRIVCDERWSSTIYVSIKIFLDRNGRIDRINSAFRLSWHLRLTMLPLNRESNVDNRRRSPILLRLNDFMEASFYIEIKQLTLTAGSAFFKLVGASACPSGGTLCVGLFASSILGVMVFESSVPETGLSLAFVKSAFDRLKPKPIGGGLGFFASVHWKTKTKLVNLHRNKFSLQHLPVISLKDL